MEVTAKKKKHIPPLSIPGTGGGTLAFSRSLPDAGGLSDLERCRALVALEVMKTHVMEGARKVLKQPDSPSCLGSPPLEGLSGMPHRILQKCEKAMRVEEALKQVPEPLRSKLTAVPVEEWAGSTGSRPGSAPTCVGRPRPGILRSMPVARCREDIERRQKHAARAAIAKACFSLLEKWVSVMWEEAPSDELPLLIAHIVHGDEPVVPLGAVGDELKRMVPRPAELEAGRRWLYMEETIATQELAQKLAQPDEKSRSLRRTSTSALGAPGEEEEADEDDFDDARKPAWSGPSPADLVRQEQAKSLAAWTKHKGQVKKLRPQLPGARPDPGAYCDRSLSRANIAPRRGQFASMGAPRTSCTVSALSTGARFPGDVQRCRPRSMQRQRSTRKKEASREGGVEVQETVWQRLLGV
mmetsp:Transcript_42567/g.109924  ORF Transcript_42567/g.109924 Transcript_42567/m.109924 type:complete len:412 (-) Transcript_42567:33-1268(-)